MDIWGRLVPRSSGQDHLDLMVSRDALPRALQVWSLLLRRLERLHLAVSVDHGRTVVHAGDDVLYLRLKERVQSRPDLPLLTPRFPSPWTTPSRQKAVGTGRLMVLCRMPDHWSETYDVCFSDGRTPLEEQVTAMGEFFLHLPERAAARRERRQQEDAARQAAQRRVQEERAQAAALHAERARRQQDVAACQAALHALAQTWEDHLRLVAYLEALDRGTLRHAVGDAAAYRHWRT